MAGSVPTPSPIDALSGLVPLHPRSSTSEQAADAIRQHITAGIIRPGAQLREEAVAAALGVSRNTVREAFRALSREGLVEHALHRGVFVREVSAHDVTDIYRTRRLLEPLGMRAVAGQAAAVRALDGIATVAEVAAAAGDWASVGSADIDFHRSLVNGCDSARIDRMFDRLFAELRLAFAAIDSARTLHEPYVARNRRLTVLLADGAVDEACGELDSYLRDAERQILAALDAAGNLSRRTASPL